MIQWFFPYLLQLLFIAADFLYFTLLISYLSTKDDSDSDPDDEDSILCPYKTLQTHPQCIYRGNLTPDSHIHRFNTMHYKIEPFSDDIYIGNWNKDKCRDYDVCIYSTGSSYIVDLFNCDMLSKGHYTTSYGTIYYTVH